MITQQTFSPEQIIKIVSSGRAKRQDSQELMETRKKWIRDLLLNFYEPTEQTYTHSNYYKEPVRTLVKGATIETCEMYYNEGEVLKGKWNIPQTFSKFHNTRKKLPTEVDFEIDSLKPEEAIKVMGEIVQRLIQEGYHFAMFFAEGGRSPHIRIYDFEDLKLLDQFQRQEAEKEFWKSICPVLWKYCDKAIWEADRPIQLEFAPHWKYGTPFDLIYEHVPSEKETQSKLNFLGARCNQ